MDNKNEKIKLSIPKYVKEKLSDFRIRLMENELSKINEHFPLEEGKIDFQVSYAVEEDNGVEVEFYIRNNTGANINMDVLPIELIKGDEVIASKVANFRNVPDIPPYSAVPVIINFRESEIIKKDFKDIMIRLRSGKNYFLVETIKVELGNLPEGFKLKHKRTLEKYVNSLPRLRKNTVDVNAYSVFYDEENNLNLVIVMRNGYDSDLEVNNIPFCIYDSRDILVYSSEFKPQDMTVHKNSASIFIIKVDKENLPIKDADFTTFRVEFEV